MKDDAGVRGVVVGDEHERARASGSPASATTFHVGPVGQAAPEPVAPAADVVGDARGGAGADERRQHPPAAPAAQRTQAGEARGPVEQAQRPPVAAVGALLLDGDAAAALAQPLGEPLGRVALALGRGVAVHAGELGDDVLEQGAIRRHGAGNPTAPR